MAVAPKNRRKKAPGAESKQAAAPGKVAPLPPIEERRERLRVMAWHQVTNGRDADLDEVRTLCESMGDADLDLWGQLLHSMTVRRDAAADHAQCEALRMQCDSLQCELAEAEAERTRVVAEQDAIVRSLRERLQDVELDANRAAKAAKTLMVTAPEHLRAEYQASLHRSAALDAEIREAEQAVRHAKTAAVAAVKQADVHSQATHPEVHSAARSAEQALRTAEKHLDDARKAHAAEVDSQAKLRAECMRTD